MAAIRRSLVAAAFALLAAGRAAAAAEDRAADAASCADLPAAALLLPHEAPVQITDAKVMPETGQRPALCRVRGYASPNTEFEVALPTAGWNGKLFYAGCTGSCGIAGESIWARECDYPLKRGYACIISDMGHRSGPGDGLWAWRNIEAKIDFGYRATHRSAQAAKAIIAAFYGTAPRHSYFMGCSTGGRQALVSAQRFPKDFDGIIAGAPVVSEAGTVMSFVWTLQQLARADGSPMFDRAAIDLLHKAAIGRLDARDGRRDGVIDDPRTGFDPATLQCGNGRDGDCLSAEQVAAARAVYAGPVDARGRQTYFGGGFLPGSEQGWLAFLPLDGKPAGATLSGTDTARYIQSDFGPGWQARDFDFDRDPERLREYEILYSASNPDLRGFRDAGGKLLIYHGWADARVAPLNSVDYYEAVTRAMGGAAATRDFARLVMVPGMEHCWGGDGAFAIDYIAAMEAWVERGEAPSGLRAAHRAQSSSGDAGPTFIHSFPAPPGTEQDVRTLPLWSSK